MTKTQLRKKHLMIRKQMDFKAVADLSETIRNKALNLEEIATCQRLFGYLSIYNEVDCWLIDAIEKHDRHQVFLVPKVDGILMTFHSVKSYDCLETGTYGILEPKHTDQVEEPRHGDIVFVPGVCFDTNGYRIGYGGGYYDRLMERCPEATYIGLAYENQVVEEVPREEHDKQLHMLITEQRILTFS